MAYLLKSADDKPILYNGEEILVTQAVNVVKGVDLERRTMVMVGSTEDKDRDGDIIMQGGWDLKNYLNNPVFLWAHTYGGRDSVPLAKTIKLVRKRNPAQLIFTLQFPSEGLNPFADMILSLYEGKFINASSVGFISREWEALEKDEADAWYTGRRFLKQELLELSGCAVPSNPMALQNAVKSFMHPQTSDKDLQTVVNVLLMKDILAVEKMGIDPIEVQGELQEMKCVFEEEGPTQVQVLEQIQNSATPGIDKENSEDYLVNNVTSENESSQRNLEEEDIPMTKEELLTLLEERDTGLKVTFDEQMFSLKVFVQESLDTIKAMIGTAKEGATPNPEPQNIPEGPAKPETDAVTEGVTATEPPADLSAEEKAIYADTISALKSINQTLKNLGG